MNLKEKKILIPVLCIILGIIIFIFGIFYETKNDKLGKVKDAIQNVFFYLPEDIYVDLNEMSDYCKISLIYGTDYIKKDVLLSESDYDTVVKKNGVEAYTKENISSSLKSILGESADINFDLNEDGEYAFLEPDECQNGNNKMQTLSYNESKGYIFSVNDKSGKTNKLYVKWDNPEYNGDYVTLRAKAFLAVKNDDGSYNIYADNNLNYLAGTASGSNIKAKIKELYDYKSLDHIITLKKEGNDYIWIKYEVVNNIYSNNIS